METVVLTIRPMNILVLAVMVGLILSAYYCVVKAGVSAKQAMGGGS